MNLCPELRRFQAEDARWLVELAEHCSGRLHRVRAATPSFSSFSEVARQLPPSS